MHLLAGATASPFADTPRVPTQAPSPLIVLPLPTLRKGLKANPVATEPRLEGKPTPLESATRSMGVARGTANPESGTAAVRDA